MANVSNWKGFERTVARFFGTQRAALSGGNGKLTRSDSMHPRLFIECKKRKKIALLSLLREAHEHAEELGEQNKKVVVCVGETGKCGEKSGFYVFCHSDDLKAIAEEVSDA